MAKQPVHGNSASARRNRRGVPPASSEAARLRMQRTRQRDTAAELALRSALHRAGLRYRVDLAPIPGVRGRADVVFPRQRIAVYVDGCFWHSCPVHQTHPRANSAWWAAKLQANRERDADTDRRLAEAGWLVLRFWEHEAPGAATQVVLEAVRARQALRFR